MGTVLTTPQYHVELIDGREVEKPLPKKLHAVCQTFLIEELNRAFQRRYRALSELNVLTGALTPEGRREYTVPDVTVAAPRMRYEEGDLAEPPIWGVEILSPGQTIADLFVRAERLLKLGCPLVWVIWPEKRKVWEYRPGDLAEKGDALLGELPDGTVVRVSLADMWEDMMRWS